MKEFKTGWTKEDLTIYTLIYCANADFYESQIEIDHIKSKIKKSDFDAIYNEFNKDNAVVRVQKIKQTIENLGYSEDEKESLFDDMREVFLTDGKFQSLEQKLHTALVNILR